MTLVLGLLMITSAQAVLKERDLTQTLRILRIELTETHQELVNQAEDRRQETKDIVAQLQETMKRSNQNALMLYSQQPNYVFDLT